jgi:signal transduction histidine kinase
MDLLDLVGLSRHILQRFSKRAAGKRINLDLVCDDTPVMAMGDERFFKEILDNLVSNALKFSPADRTVLVRVEKTATAARVSVEDQGPGLTEEDRKKLFTRFARLSAKPTAGEKSTGLGLSIVKHMVEGMKGRIWVDSGPGLGAAFRFELPLPPPPAPEP